MSKYRTSNQGDVIVQVAKDPISLGIAKTKGDDWFCGQIIWSNGSVDVCGGGELLKFSSYPIEMDYDKTLAFLKQKK